MRVLLIHQDNKISCIPIDKSSRLDGSRSPDVFGRNELTAGEERNVKIAAVYTYRYTLG